MFGEFVNQDDLDRILETKDYEELVFLLEAAEKDEQYNDDIHWHKAYYTDTYTKRRIIINQLVEFSEVDVEFKMSCKLDSGFIIINDKFIVAPRSGKWRVKGKGMWYRYSKDRPSEFIKKYVLKERRL